MMISFLVAAILIELTPGPNMTWLAVLGATRGRMSALAAVAGIAAGLTVAACVAGLGLAALIIEVPQLFEVLRWAGALYLFYLAWDAWRDADGAMDTSNLTTGQAFTQGFVSNILNPKAYLFYAVLLPQFLDPASPAPQQIAILSAIFVTVATTIHCGIALLSSMLAGWLQASPHAQTVRKTLAVLLAATAAWLFLATRLG